MIIELSLKKIYVQGTIFDADTIVYASLVLLV